MKKLLSSLKDKGKSQSGVSILTLVITIIVIIILAVITLNGNFGTVDESVIADYRHELKSVEVSVSAQRINNQEGGIGEEFKEKGFYPVLIENPPIDFVSFGDGEFYGYVVDLKLVDEDSANKGDDYKKYTNYNIANYQTQPSITFGKNGKDNDVYIYDATGKVYYAKGLYAEGGVYYSDILTKDGPTINIEEKRYDATNNVVELIFTVEPEIDDTNMLVMVNDDVVTKDADDKYKYTVTSNGTYMVKAEEDDERKSKKRVSVTEIVEMQYTITYHFNDGETENAIQIKEGSTPVKVKMARREGYTLKGWSKSESSLTVDYAPGSYYEENANADLYAIWEEGEPREFTIIYNANGGTNAPEPSIKTERETIQLKPLTAAETPIRDGYTFLGWAKSSSSDTPDYLAGSDYTEESDKVLYAVWEEGVTRVEVAINPTGAGEATGTGPQEAGRMVYIQAKANPGYVFDKWSVAPNSVNVQLENTYNETTRFKMPNGTVSLIANFKLTEYDYTIKYDANKGTGAPTTQYKKHDVDINLSDIIPKRSGHTFLGWSDTASAKSVKYSSGEIYTENKSVTLYAVWSENTENFTLSFDANGGTNPPSSITKPKDTIITIPVDAPTNGNQYFLGWSESKIADDPSYRINDLYTITQDKTLYAVWSDTEKPIVRITAGEKDNKLVLNGIADDQGGVVSYVWTTTFYAKDDYSNIVWTDLSSARQKIEIEKEVIGTGIHYFYAKDGDGNIAYASIDVYRMNFYADGVKVDTRYKAANYGASLSNVIPEKATYVFTNWESEIEGRVYYDDDKYLLDRDENFHAIFDESVAYIPSTNKYFLSTQDAVDTVPTNVTDYVLVQLLKNETTEGVQIKNGQKVSLSTGTNTINSTQTTISIESGASFKLVDGTITSDVYGIRNIGTLEIETGKITAPYGIYNTGNATIGLDTENFSQDAVVITSTEASYETVSGATLYLANGSFVDKKNTETGTIYQVPTSGMQLRPSYELRKIGDSSSNEIITTLVEDLVMTPTVTAGAEDAPVEITVTLSTITNNFTFQYSTDNQNWITGTSVALIDNVTLYGRILENSEVVNTDQITIDSIVRLNVTFDAQGIIANPAPAQVDYQRTYGSALPDTSDTDEYYFLGWWTEATGGTEVESTDIVEQTADFGLYAHWELKNQAPNVPTVTADSSSKTTSSIPFTITGTDPDGDDLTYQLYLTSSTGTIEESIGTLASGQSTVYTATGLSEYKDYTYYVVATDPSGLTETSTSNVERTYCPGTGSNCSSTSFCTANKGDECDECSGTGNGGSPSYSDIVGPSSNESIGSCSNCGGELVAVYGYVGGDKRQISTSCMGSCGNVEYVSEVVYVDGEYKWATYGSCSDCSGTGYKYNSYCSTHGRSGMHYYCNTHSSYVGQSASHTYCTHGKTSQHDS